LIKKTYDVETCKQALYKPREHSIPWPDDLGTTITKDVTNDELYEILKEGPVSVSIRITLSDSLRYIFQNLFSISETIYTQSHCGTSDDKQTNHEVTLFGYVNNPDGDDYWVVRNSWGSGDIQFNRKFTANDYDNACGLRTEIFSVSKKIPQWMAKSTPNPPKSSKKRKLKHK